MFADMTGYTAMMQEDEAHATVLRQRQRQTLDSLIPAHHGTILQYFGDGTLSIFDSAADAVRCGIAIQNELQKEPRVKLRIGIHSGDVQPGQGTSVTVNLPPGDWYFYCNIPGHEQAGMLGTLAIFFGIAMVAPFVIRPLVRALSWPFRKLFPVEGRLAGERRMVRRRDRDPEERHDAVADVLVHERLLRLQALRHPVEVAVDERHQHVGVHLLRDRRERLHVRKEERPGHLRSFLDEGLHQRFRRHFVVFMFKQRYTGFADRYGFFTEATFFGKLPFALHPVAE